MISCGGRNNQNMSIKEKFCRYSKHICPDCGSKLKEMLFLDDEVGVSYTERFLVCDECDYQENITDKRSKNTKIEIMDSLPDKPNKSDKQEKFKYKR
jgi:hypothetical protein